MRTQAESRWWHSDSISSKDRVEPASTRCQQWGTRAARWRSDSRTQQHRWRIASCLQGSTGWCSTIWGRLPRDCCSIFQQGRWRWRWSSAPSTYQRYRLRSRRPSRRGSCTGCTTVSYGGHCAAHCGRAGDGRAAAVGVVARIRSERGGASNRARVCGAGRDNDTHPAEYVPDEHSVQAVALPNSSLSNPQTRLARGRHAVDKEGAVPAAHARPAREAVAKRRGAASGARCGGASGV